MSNVMDFPATVEEFMDLYMTVDTKQIYSNGTEYVPIFRMKQWFEHEKNSQPMKKGKWIKMSDADGYYYACSECGEELFREWVFDREFDIVPHLRSIDKTPYCPHCGAKMESEKEGE